MWPEGSVLEALYAQLILTSVDRFGEVRPLLCLLDQKSKPRFTDAVSLQRLSQSGW